MALWKVGFLAAVLCLGLTATASAGTPMAAASDCGGSDTVASAVCMTEGFLFGPTGVVPFTTHQVEWARGIVFDVIFVVFPGGLL